MDYLLKREKIQCEKNKTLRNNRSTEKIRILGPCQALMLELFRKYIKQLLAVYHFRKKISQIDYTPLYYKESYFKTLHGKDVLKKVNTQNRDLIFCACKNFQLHFISTIKLKNMLISRFPKQLEIIFIFLLRFEHSRQK